MSPRRAHRALLTGLVLVVLTSGCANTPLVAAPGTGGGGTTPAPTATPAPAPPAPAPAATATPASSPRATVDPAGRVLGLGLGLGEGALTTLTLSPADQRAVVVQGGPGSSSTTVQIDPDTASVITRTPVPGSPRTAVSAADRAGLVLADPSRGVSRIGLPSGAPGDSPDDVPAGPQALAVGPAGQLLVAATGVPGDARRDAASTDVDGTLSVLSEGRVTGRVGGLGRPVAIAVAGQRVAVLDAARNLIHLVDLTTMRVEGTLPAGDGPTNLVIDRHGRLLITDTRAGALRRYDLTQDRPVPLAAVELGRSSAPYGTAYDAVTDRLWVTLTGTNRLVALDLGSPDRPRAVLDLPTVTQPDLVAVGQGRVLVGSPRTGQVQITLA